MTLFLTDVLLPLGVFALAYGIKNFIRQRNITGLVWCMIGFLTIAIVILDIVGLPASLLPHSAIIKNTMSATAIALWAAVAIFRF